MTSRGQKLQGNPNAVPYGARLLQRFPRPSWLSRIVAYRVAILLTTYFVYVTYHLSRRPLGVVKNVWAPSNCSTQHEVPVPVGNLSNNASGENACAWEPFNYNSKQKFSWLDFAFRFSYAVGMVVAGQFAERMDLRLFLSFGMVMAGLFVIINGMAYFWKIHVYSFFVVAQLLAGTFQGTGWSSVVPLVGNWFGKRRLGIIFGIWNSHTSVGNILGSVIAGVWVDNGWGYSFIVPGLIIMVAGVIVYLFVVVGPEDVGLPPPDYEVPRTETTDPSALIRPDVGKKKVTDNGSSRMLSDYAQIPSDSTEIEEEKKAIGLWQAVKIPGVWEFSLCLFFSKAVYYTFFFWLPVYIKETTDVTNHNAADLSAVFDAGGIIGGIIAGAISDATGGTATVCGFMFILAVPSLYCMVQYIGQGFAVLIVLLVITGLFVNGPYALITTVVSTDLGTRPSLVKNTHALATVVTVIDGMGSLGSAFGPLVAGLLAEKGWHDVFYFLIGSQVLGLLCLTRLIYREVRVWILKAKRKQEALATEGHQVRPPSQSEKTVTTPSLILNLDPDGKRRTTDGKLFSI